MALSNFFLRDRTLWAFTLLISRCWAKARSFVISRSIKAPGLFIGGKLRCSGTKYIDFGEDLYMSGDIWIEAVSYYCGVGYDPQIRIGARTSFSKNVHLTSVYRIDIGEDVLFGSNVYIADHAHGEYRNSPHSRPSDAPAKRPLGNVGAVVIGDKVWIGNNVIIIGPVTIGSGVIVAANSVVNRDVASDTIVAGAPALPVKKFDNETQRWNAVENDSRNA